MLRTVELGDDFMEKFLCVSSTLEFLGERDGSECVEEEAYIAID